MFEIRRVSIWVYMLYKQGESIVSEVKLSLKGQGSASCVNEEVFYCCSYEQVHISVHTKKRYFSKICLATFIKVSKSLLPA